MYFINCDCSIEPFNPGGILAWAFIVKQNKKVIHKDCRTSLRGKEATNNIGEYHAVIAALLWLIQLPPEKQRRPAIIMSDSQLIVNQLSGSWNCNSENLIPLRDMAHKAMKRYLGRVTLKWVPRSQNQEADALSRTAYDEDELKYYRDNQLDIIFDGDDITF